MLSPATRARFRSRLAKRRPLNEGRDVKPGDTGHAHTCYALDAPRSTKAGMLSPATPPNELPNGGYGWRSTKAGMLSPATRAWRRRRTRAS